MKEHWYAGTHNTWYGEPVHECGCGFESHEKPEVDEHIAAESMSMQDAIDVIDRAVERQKERIEESWLEMRADLHRGED